MSSSFTGFAHEAERLVPVLLNDAAKFERPSEREVALFDRYVGPNDEWTPVSLASRENELL